MDADLIKRQKLVTPVEHSSIGNALHRQVEWVEELAPRRVANTEGASVQHLACCLLLQHGLSSDILVLKVHLAVFECKLADLHMPHTESDLTKKMKGGKKKMKRRAKKQMRPLCWKSCMRLGDGPCSMTSKYIFLVIESSDS